MKGADRSGALLTVIVGERDLEAGDAQVKDMVSGEQHAVPLGDLTAEVVNRLKEKLS
jgi:histidyl-tRNA synthetase